MELMLKLNIVYDVKCFNEINQQVYSYSIGTNLFHWNIINYIFFKTFSPVVSYLRGSNTLLIVSQY